MADMTPKKAYTYWKGPKGDVVYLLDGRLEGDDWVELTIAEVAEHWYEVAKRLENRVQELERAPKIGPATNNLLDTLENYLRKHDDGTLTMETWILVDELADALNECGRGPHRPW